MEQITKSTRLIKRVQQRMALAVWGQKIFVSFCITLGVYLALMLFSRFSGYLSDWFTLPSLGVVAVGTIVLSIILFRKPDNEQAARLIDQNQKTKDLFLTVTMLEEAIGNYKPLVIQDAEQQAVKIQPAQVVPFVWARRFAICCSAGLVLFLLLESDFRKMVPGKKLENAETLAARQKSLGSQWRKRAEENMKSMMMKTDQAQKFGGMSKEEGMQKWSKELQEGSTQSLMKEMEELKEKLQRLQKETDPVKREQLKNEIQKKMKEMESFARE